MKKRSKVNRRKNNRVLFKILIVIVIILILIFIGIVIFSGEKSDIALILPPTEDNTTKLNENLDKQKDTNEDESDIKEEINISENKQELVYTSYENDVFADNAKSVENMLDEWNYIRDDGKKIAYLTFDDGPSTNVTPEILNILKENQVKATFFVLGSNLEYDSELKEVFKNMVKDGHAIGNHGYSHDYKTLYPSRVADIGAFMNDIKRSEDVMESVLGNNFVTKVIRFPGGHMSWNTSDLDSVLEANGYSYIDWNVINGDAEGNYMTTKQLIDRLRGCVNDLKGNDDVLVVLMHDTNAKGATAQALQEAIDYLRMLGYEFRTLK